MRDSRLVNSITVCGRLYVGRVGVTTEVIITSNSRECPVPLLFFSLFLCSSLFFSSLLFSFLLFSPLLFSSLLSDQFPLLPNSYLFFVAFTHLHPLYTIEPTSAIDIRYSLCLYLLVLMAVIENLSMRQRHNRPILLNVLLNGLQWERIYTVARFTSGYNPRMEFSKSIGHQSLEIFLKILAFQSSRKCEKELLQIGIEI